MISSTMKYAWLGYESNLWLGYEGNLVKRDETSGNTNSGHSFNLFNES